MDPLVVEKCAFSLSAAQIFLFGSFSSHWNSQLEEWKEEASKQCIEQEASKKEALLKESDRIVGTGRDSRWTTRQ